MSDQVAGASGIAVKTSPLSVADAVARLSQLIAERGMRLFAGIHALTDALTAN